MWVKRSLSSLQSSTRCLRAKISIFFRWVLQCCWSVCDVPSSSLWLAIFSSFILFLFHAYHVGVSYVSFTYQLHKISYVCVHDGKMMFYYTQLPPSFHTHEYREMGSFALWANKNMWVNMAKDSNPLMLENKLFIISSEILDVKNRWWGKIFWWGRH